MAGNGNGNWYGAAKAAHTKALATPQGFSLTGDGEHTAGLLTAPERGQPDMLGARLAESRYRDWRAQQGEMFARHQDGPAPEFRLTAEQAPRQSGQVSRLNGTARAIIAELVEIIEDSGLAGACSAELARAKAYLLGRE